MLKLGGSSATLQTNGNWWVNLTFTSEGAKAFGALSTKMYDNYYDASTSQPSSELDFFAIVLDGTPVAVPYMAAVLDTGTAQIQGTFTQNQGQSLANVLNYGALPLSFQKESAQSVYRPARRHPVAHGTAGRAGRPAARGDLRVPVLPGPGHRGDLQPGHRGAAVVPDRGAAERLRELRHVAGGHRRA